MLSSVSQADDLSKIDFLLGCWKLSSGEQTKVENWERVSETEFNGNAKNFKKDKVVFWETLKIKAQSGKVVYQPLPMGKAWVLFTLQDNQVSGNRAEFVNWNHDFPQQIIYSQLGKSVDSLHVEVKGKDENGQPMEFEYTLKKVVCE